MATSRAPTLQVLLIILLALDIPSRSSPPLWPLVSGAIAGLTGIGHSVPFPSQGALGPNCSGALTAMTHWSAEAKALNPTVQLGYLCWFVLMAGVVALLRASGRGRCGWEPAIFLVFALTPFVMMPLLDDFHPQDVVAMGLILGGVACARRGWWVRAGLLLGLAVTSQQFAFLVLAPLLVVAPPIRPIRFAGAAISAVALVVLPLIAVTSGHALRAITLGSGDTLSIGGTVLWELHLQGVFLVGISRILPILFAMVLAWWAERRLGNSLLEPVPLLSLVATSISLRLVFEQNLFGYYFMALAVSLLILDVVHGQLRGQVVAWLSLVVLAFDPAPRVHVLSEYSPSVLMVIVCLVILWSVRHGHLHWYLVSGGVGGSGGARLRLVSDWEFWPTSPNMAVASCARQHRRHARGQTTLDLEVRHSRSETAAPRGWSTEPPHHCSRGSSSMTGRDIQSARPSLLYRPLLLNVGVFPHLLLRRERQGCAALLDYLRPVATARQRKPWIVLWSGHVNRKAKTHEHGGGRR